MIIDQINLNQIKVFISVFDNKNMTQAAEKLHLTQSGVSQHIKSLEQALQVKLFDRIKKNIVPTSEAQHLYKMSTESFNQLEKTLYQISGAKKEVKGIVSIGMPVEFGYNIVQPLLARFGQKYPKVIIQMELGLAPDMQNLLLTGQLDMALVDDFGVNENLNYQKVYNESLFLCASQSYIKKNRVLSQNSIAKFEAMSFIAYQRNHQLLNKWFEFHYKKALPKLNVRSIVADSQIVGRFITSHLGLGIIPDHLLERLKSEGNKFHVFQDGNRALKNKIHLSILKNKSQSLASRTLKQYLIEKIAAI